MGRDCLVEAGKGSRNASERPGEGFLPPGAGSHSRALPRAKIAFNSDQWSIKLSIVRESLVNVQWQLLERASSIILEVLTSRALSPPRLALCVVPLGLASHLLRLGLAAVSLSVKLSVSAFALIHIS